MNPLLDCFSVGAADISIENFAVGPVVVILTVHQTNVQSAVSLQRPRGSTGFTQNSCSAQPELLKILCPCYENGEPT